MCVRALAVYILVLLKRLRFCYTLMLLNEADIYHKTLAHQIINNTRSRYIRHIYSSGKRKSLKTSGVRKLTGGTCITGAQKGEFKEVDAQKANPPEVSVQ